MNHPHSPLVGLFLALFTDSDQLSRFIRGLPTGQSVLLRVDEKQTITFMAEELAERLNDHNLIDGNLFDRLLKERPSRHKDIEEVRAELLPHKKGLSMSPVIHDDGKSAAEPDIEAEPSPSPEPPSTKPTSPSRQRGATRSAVPKEQTDWRRQMEALLGEVVLERPELPGPWLDAAAVLPSFDPLRLEPVGGPVDPPRDLLERLAEVCDLLPDGTMSLRLRPRQEALARMSRDGVLGEALDANPDHQSIQRRLLKKALEAGEIKTTELETLEEVRAAHQLTEWLARSELRPFDPDQVASVLERYRRVEPLRRLLGRHFRGRDDELGILHQHLKDRDDESILMLWGVGGVGKSTLVGKVLLDLEKTGDPWVYLDFDDPEVDPLDPRDIVEKITRQLGQFFSSADVAKVFLDLEAQAAGDVGRHFQIELQPLASIEELMEAIDMGLRQLPRQPAFTLVLDTFEQVQVQGRHAVDSVRELLDTISESLPYARIVVSGRAEVLSWNDAEELPLEDLDPEGADAVLEALGLKDPDLRAKVIDRVGRSPLSLRLAADAIQSDQLSEKDLEEMVVGAQKLQLQGRLYTRILGHIRDSEVRRLAHPGLIVRRVTIGVIRDVLADLCDLDPARAESLFERLPDHVSLFEPDHSTPAEGRALRHRQDVREIMIRLMKDDPAWSDKLGPVHDRAIAHYAGRDDDLALAERIYHHLMRGDDPHTLDDLWRPALKSSLARCWQEPLSDRARAWLAPRIGRDHGDHGEWSTKDWESVAAREAEAHLRSEDYAGALEVLHERPDRSPGSRLFRLEARALNGLGRYQEAIGVVDGALSGDSEALGSAELMELHLCAARSCWHLENLERLRQHTERALLIADQTGNLGARMRALGFRVRTGDLEARARLEDVFVDAHRVELLRDEDLSKQILALLQPHSLAVLDKVATVFGNRSDQNMIKLDAFALEGLIKKVGETEVGKESLSNLATEIGLSKKDFQARDIANQSIRYNKMGDVLSTVLNNIGNDEANLREVQEIYRVDDVKGEL